MTLSAHDLTTLQRCPRRWHLEQEWQPLRWHPKTLFDALLRQAILSLSQGQPKEAVVQEAQTRLLEIAASPGLAAGDPYTLAQDFCAAFETIIEAVSRRSLLSLREGGLVTIGLGLAWRLGAFRDDSGAIHRWTTLDRITLDSIARELHSWYVYGDLVVAGGPMALHVIELGSIRNSHIYGPWTRAFAHPVIANHYKFQTVAGQKLGSGWKPVWYQGADQDPKVWVDLMQRDKVPGIKDYSLTELSEAQLAEGKSQILNIVAGLPNGTWDSIPLSRPACDFPYVCPWQEVCYAPGIVKIEDIGGYRRR